MNTVLGNLLNPFALVSADKAGEYRILVAEFSELGGDGYALRVELLET